MKIKEQPMDLKSLGGPCRFDPGSGHIVFPGVPPISAFLPRFSSGPQSRGSQRVDVAFFSSSALEAFHSTAAPYRVRPVWRVGVFVPFKVVDLKV